MRRLAAVLLLAAPAACAEAEGLRAADGWIREAPPGAPVMAGYVTLHNGGRETLRCDRAQAADFGAAEIHRSVVEAGRSRMLRNQVVELPAGGSARLEPGSFHLMLFRPQRPLAAGEVTQIRLVCGAHALDIPFTIRSAP